MLCFSRLIIFLALNVSSAAVFSQSMLLRTTNVDYEITNIFSDVDVFEFSIEINEPLAVGLFENPPIENVTYRVVGNLSTGTPSGFPMFSLEREISGEEFYAQGSSLQFEISPTAVLQDGIQVDELAGSDLVFQFDGREIDNGRFHPALFVLRADGTGRIQNSNNIPSLEPFNEIEVGSEYINDLLFDPGNTTLIVSSATDSGSSGGSIGLLEVIVLLLFGVITPARVTCSGTKSNTEAIQGQARSNMRSNPAQVS